MTQNNFKIPQNRCETGLSFKKKITRHVKAKTGKNSPNQSSLTQSVDVSKQNKKASPKRTSTIELQNYFEQQFNDPTKPFLTPNSPEI